MLSAIVTSILLSSVVEQGRPGQVLISAGWHDEMDRQSDWKHLSVGNKPSLGWSVPGKLKLSLGRVPSDWTYQYQWSGVTRKVQLDIGKYCCISAYVPEVTTGYAHLDIDVLSDSGKVLQTFRSSTLQAPGVCIADLTNLIMVGTYTFQIRLIVGGQNGGCSATYDWIRFTSARDAKRLQGNPDLRVEPESFHRHH